MLSLHTNVEIWTGCPVQEQALVTVLPAMCMQTIHSHALPMSTVLLASTLLHLHGAILYSTSMKVCYPTLFNDLSVTVTVLLFSIVTSCLTPEHPVTGSAGLTIQFNRTVIGSTAVYSCSSDYVLVGNSTRVCQTNGNWTGSPPHCKGKNFKQALFWSFKLLFDLSSYFYNYSAVRCPSPDLPFGRSREGHRITE